MINTKITKQASQPNTEEKVLKLLESIDWKLWEMYNMMKDNLPASKTSGKTAVKPKKEESQEKTD